MARRLRKEIPEHHHKKVERPACAQQARIRAGRLPTSAVRAEVAKADQGSGADPNLVSVGDGLVQDQHNRAARHPGPARPRSERAGCHRRRA